MLVCGNRMTLPLPQTGSCDRREVAVMLALPQLVPWVKKEPSPRLHMAVNTGPVFEQATRYAGGTRTSPIPSGRDGGS